MHVDVMRLVAVFTAGAALVGCGVNEPIHYTGTPPCAVAANCNSPSGGASGTPPLADAGASDASTGPTDVSGSVVSLQSNTFDSSAPYYGALTIRGPAAAGGSDVIVSYGGMGGPKTFTLAAVSSGPVWLYAHDETSGGGGILSTYTAHYLPATGAITLPVVDTHTLQTIALGQGGMLLSDQASQLIVRVVRGGTPLAGVRLTAGAAGATIAYDTGPGVYSNIANATGTAGTILILNASGAGVNGQLSLTVMDAVTTLYTIDLPVSPGAVTMSVDELKLP